MAWNFKTTDIASIAAIANVHPDPPGWWAVVAAEASDQEVIDLANAILGVYAGGQPTKPQAVAMVIEELSRIADTEAELELTRVDEDSGGGTVTYQAKGRGFIG